MTGIPAYVAGKVKHRVGLERLDQLPDGVGVDQVNAMPPRTSGLIGVLITGRRMHVGTLSAQPFAQTGTDEPAGPGDQHRASVEGGPT